MAAPRNLAYTTRDTLFCYPSGTGPGAQPHVPAAQIVHEE
jgi:hypothetical protein